MSLKELTKICQKITKNKIKIGKIAKTSNYDIPYYITDNSKVSRIYGWQIKNIHQIVEDIYTGYQKIKK